MAEIHELNPVDDSNTGRWPENMPFSGVNDAGRADEGMLARLYQDMDGSRTASGSANAFAVTSSRTISALFNNLALVFTANHAISGSSTLNLNGLGAKSIRRLNGMNVVTGDIVSGQPVYVVFKTALDQWLMMSAPAALGTPTLQVLEVAAPATPASGEAVFYTDTDGQARHKNDAGSDRVLSAFSGQLLHVRNEQTSGGAAESITGGDWRTRTLNESKTNEITGASLATNQITLPAGTYWVEAHGPIATSSTLINSRHQSRLQNVSDATTAVLGANGQLGGVRGNTSDTANWGPAISPVRGRFTIAAEKVFELQTRTSASCVGGLATSWGTEVYAEVMIFKVR